MADQRSFNPESSGEHKGSGEKNGRWLRALLFAFLVLFTLFVVGSMATVGAAAGYVASLVNEEPIREREELEGKITGWSQTSYAYFQDGKAIGRLRVQEGDRKVVTHEEVSPHLVHALISTEDREFYEHDGVVPKSILRAAWQQATGSQVQTGGSTITQQLVKNIILDNRAQSLDRKAKEIFLALRMEHFFSKDQILDAYLNSLYFGKDINGRHMLGVQAAAQGMFGVDAKDLNLSQAAYIAGMVQRPNAYNPFRGEENLKYGTKRMQWVLRKMEETGSISEAESKEAASFDIAGSLAEEEDQPTTAHIRYPYITMTVELEAAKILMREDGLDAQKLSEEGKYLETLQEYKNKVWGGGYQIHTTVDQKLYDAINEAALKDNLYARPTTFTLNGREYKNAKEQVGATLLDTKTGATLAFVGGRDFEEDQNNYAFDTSRQPGSTIKPLLDFGPGLDKGVISPDSIIIDEPLKARYGNHVYRNYTNRYSGAMTARDALKLSMNIPSIKVLRSVGVQNGFEYLEKMNFPVHENDGEASAIGGFTRGFDVQRMTAGYAMMGNEGKFNEPYIIERIEDSAGNVVYQHQPDPVQVFSPQAAYWTTDMLRDVIRSGTGTYIGARAPGYDLAGKTGTTQNTNDVWFIGYTPDISLGVWTGYGVNKRLPDDMRARYVWASIFQALIQADPELVKKNSRFKSQPPYSFKCYECKRAEEEKEKKEKEKREREERNNQQPEQPQLPQLPDNGNTPPGNGTPDPGNGSPDPNNPDNPGDDVTIPPEQPDS
ncbi:transglycosylase domain-containing protein [Desmospora profundinema]|uniref:Penicillin-binding protein n=1 Tax=Desmospora profundinema TaxID=1571184 RepID=A0ABU1IJY5_9BACL|nr:transglycosylase domain-containing protein [Desmospora profundinema]MDR6225094.1 penicillin-binding protein [Desmospora profundinema]